MTVMKKTITAQAIAMLVAPREKGDLVSVSYDAETGLLSLQWADIPPRPMFLLETDEHMTAEQIAATQE